MKLETFFEKFDQFADAPDAVAKMRELVLELGIAGKLTYSNDSKIDLWIHAQLDQIARLRRGYDLPTQAREEGAVPIYAANGPVGLHNKAAVKGPGVVTGRSGSIGKVHYVQGDYWPLNTALYVENFFGNDPEFICLLLRSMHLEQFSTCTAVPTLNRNVVHKEIVQVPPLAEQKRIVAKVDELMALCDRLEAQQQERDTRRAALARASLARFADAPTPANLNFLFHKSYDISPADLRKSILTLAVQGKLVPQDPNDEPVSELLNRLVLLTARGGKIPKPLAPIDTDSLPFEIPCYWEWAQAQDLCRASHIITYGVLKPVWVDVGVPTIRVQDIQNGEIVLGCIGQCSPERAAKFGKTTLESGDIVIAKDGATLGKTAFVPPSLTGGNITQHVLRFPVTSQVDGTYVRLVIDSPHGQAWMKGETKGVALPGVNVGDFRRMPIPLPPLAEQRRIVAKVDQLMALVDELETHLAASRATAKNLLEALVNELTAAGAPSRREDA